MSDMYYEIKEQDGKFNVQFPRFDPISRDVDYRHSSFLTLHQALAWVYDDQYEDADEYPEYVGLPVYWEHRIITFF